MLKRSMLLITLASVGFSGCCFGSSQVIKEPASPEPYKQSIIDTLTPHLENYKKSKSIDAYTKVLKELDQQFNGLYGNAMHKEGGESVHRSWEIHVRPHFFQKVEGTDKYMGPDDKLERMLLGAAFSEHWLRDAAKELIRILNEVTKIRYGVSVPVSPKA